MRIQRLQLSGLKDAHELDLPDLGALVQLPPAPEGMAVADGLMLWGMALDATRVKAALTRAGMAGPELEIHLDSRGFPEQLTGLDPVSIEGMLHPDASRKMLITARLALDPPLFGRLRDESLRDPRMLGALAEDPTVAVKVGWLFTKDLTAASVGVLDVRVAKTAFPTGRSERPKWMDGMLSAIGERVGGVGAVDDAAMVCARVLEATLSSDIVLRRRVMRMKSAFDEAPFSMGVLQLVRAGDGVVAGFGPDLRRVRQLGPRASRALRIVEAALVHAPDVLVVEDDAAWPWRHWLQGLTEGDDATLEQVFVLSGST